MSEIAKTCDDIIKKRKEERLPAIINKIKTLDQLQETLEALRKYQFRLASDSPSIVAIKEKAPQVVEVIRSINLTDLLGFENERKGEETGKIAELRKELKRLHKRFSRDAIQVALVGHARQGKSTFLQAVSGLDDDVIPTSSGSDCTGAVSVIENSDTVDFEMTIEYYEEKDFIAFFNTTLRQNGLNHSISDIRGIRDLGTVLKKEMDENPTNEKMRNFYDEYYEHGLDYLDLLGTHPDPFIDKSVVTELVAKHKKFNKDSDIPESYRRYSKVIGKRITVYFNKYLAVKTAHIKCDYKLPDADKIIMLDTVGLGNENTGKKDIVTMYRVLKEDTDAAIFNFDVPVTGLSKPPEDVIDEINGVFKELDGYMPELWVSVNQNCYGRNRFNNEDDFETNDDLCKEIYQALLPKRYGVEDRQISPLHFAMVHNNDRGEVVNEMMIPVLKGISDNVSKIDDVFMSKAEKMADDIYAEYNDICARLLRAFDKIIMKSGSFNSTFKKNFYDLKLRGELEEYVRELYRLRDTVCQEIIDEIKPQVDNLTGLVPSEEEIADQLRGMKGGHIQKVYLDYSDIVAARISAKLKDVSAKTIEGLQKKIKIDIAKILYTSGLLCELSVSTGKVNNDSDYIRWLDSFRREKLSTYPSLENAVVSILDFKMNIEGFIYAECIKACEVLKDHRLEFPNDNEPITDKAYFIWDTIIRKVAGLKSEINAGLGLSRSANAGFNIIPKTSEMAKPSLLMWCVADSFFKQFINTNSGEDLENFYSEYANVIWRNEFKLQDDISEATAEVNNLITSMKSQNDRAKF